MNKLFLFFYLVFFANCFCSDEVNNHIAVLEAKLNRLSLDIKNNNCNQDVVTSLFMEATKLIDKLKTIQNSIKNNQNGDNTTHLISMNRVIQELEGVVTKIESFKKQCTEHYNNLATHEEMSPHNTTQVAHITLAEFTPPVYNNPEGVFADSQKK